MEEDVATELSQGDDRVAESDGGMMWRVTLAGPSQEPENCLSASPRRELLPKFSSPPATTQDFV